MTEISAAKIKDLREMTGAGMMDCKKALTEAKGDMDAAVDWLRTKGLAAAAKKAGRVAAEGLVAIAASAGKAAVIELNSETDFVARNDQFQSLAETFAKAALELGSNDVAALENATVGGKTVKDLVTDGIATIGENIALRRVGYLTEANGVVAHYIHTQVKAGMGKIGVLVALKSEGNKEKLEQFGRQLAMHIAAARPEGLTREEIPAEMLARERAVFKEQAIASGKPAEIAEKMVEGRIRKFYEEVILTEQVFVLDGKSRVSEAVAEAEKEVGAAITITGFKRLNLGEGIEKKEDDFAAEVAKVANG
jgi:elongation factor Ts